MGNIYSAIGAGVPTGTIMPWPSETPPKGWLICDGSEVSRTTYARLFAVIGTRFGEGDGSTTFNLPDLRGRVPAGLHSTDGDFDQIGKRGGAKTHTLTMAEIPHHDHGGSTAISGGHNHGSLTGSAGEHNHGGLTGNGGDHNHGGSTSSDGSHSHTASTNSAGSHNHPIYVNRGYPDSVPVMTGYGWFENRDTYVGPYMADAGAHTHSVTVNSSGLHSHTISASGSHAHIISSVEAHAHTIFIDGNHTHNISGQGGGQAHNNLQPYVVLNFIIKT